MDITRVKNQYNYTLGDLKSVDEFDYDKYYLKVINSKKLHNGMKYKKGLNVDIRKFNDNPYKTCVSGGLYFTTLEYLPFFGNYGTQVAIIKIPKDAKLILDTGFKNKYRADKIEIIEFVQMNEFLSNVGYTVMGDVNFKFLKSSSGFENLKYIHGDADFLELNETLSFRNLKAIYGKANFQHLKCAKGLENLKVIDDRANFEALTSSKGLENLEHIYGNAYFDFKNDRLWEEIPALKSIMDEDERLGKPKHTITETYVMT